MNELRVVNSTVPLYESESEMRTSHQKHEVQKGGISISSRHRLLYFWLPDGALIRYSSCLRARLRMTWRFPASSVARSFKEW